METKELIPALREDAEWAHANEWETPITLGDHLDAAAGRLAAYEDLGTVEELAALKERTADAWLQLRTATFSTNKGAADLAKFILSILPEAPNGAGKEQNDDYCSNGERRESEVAK